MKNPIRLSAAFAFFFATAFSARADYSPLQVGNEWVYQGRTRVNIAMNHPAEVRFDERLTLKVVSRQAYRDSTRWIVAFKDSLSHRVAMDRPVGADTTAFQDTLIKASFTFTEIEDSLVLVPPPDLGLNANFYLFPISKLLVFNDFFHFHSKPMEFSTEVAGAQGGG